MQGEGENTFNTKPRLTLTSWARGGFSVRSCCGRKAEAVDSDPLLPKVHLRVNGGRGGGFVPHEFLDDPQVCPVSQKFGRIIMPELVSRLAE